MAEQNGRWFPRETRALDDLIYENLPVTISVLLLLARFGDVMSTYLATPTLRFEANPIARRLGWRFAWATLLLAGVPFIPRFGTTAGLMLLIPSMMVTSSNLRSGWFASALGEERYAELLEEVVRSSSLRSACARSIGSGAIMALVGLILVWFYPTPGESWAWWIGWGIVTYGFAIGLHQTLYIRRAYQRVRQGDSVA